jgi:hypothetical protein
MTASEMCELINIITEELKRMIDECDSLDELKRIEQLTTGKNGFYTQMQREIGRLIKESRIAK